MNDYTQQINKIINYINSKPKEEKNKILNFIDSQYNNTMSLSRNVLRFYREQKPETFKKIIEE